MAGIGFDLAIVLVLVLINGVMAMSEMAVVSSRRVRLQQRAEEGSAGATAALALADEPSRFLSTVQIAITLVGILAGAFGGASLSEALADALRGQPVVGPYAGTVAFVVVVAGITYLSLVVGELAPKRLALRQPERIAALVARPMNVVSRLTSPVVTLLAASTDLILRVLRVGAVDNDTVTEDEVRLLLQQGAQAGVIDESEHEIVMEVFRLGDRAVDDIMTPRPRVTWIEEGATIEEVRQVLDGSPHSSFPVVAGSLDKVVGVVSIQDLWRRWQPDQPFALAAICHKPLFVPRTLPALQLLERFRREREEMAIVVDEFGGVIGLITLQDIVDEIVGETAGESVDQTIAKESARSWLVDGLATIYEVEEVIGVLDLVERADDQYGTVGGLVMTELGRIPAMGDTVVWDNWCFEVIAMDQNRVARVRVSRLHEEDREFLGNTESSSSIPE